MNSVGPWMSHLWEYKFSSKKLRLAAKLSKSQGEVWEKVSETIAPLPGFADELPINGRGRRPAKTEGDVSRGSGKNH
jgi:hypothetical protein